LIAAAFVLLLLKQGHAFFQVREIRVCGAALLAQDEIIARAGLRQGMSMLMVREKEAARRLLSLPAVRSASVYRRFPHTLDIVLDEREPAAYLPDWGGFWVIDRDGIVFERWPAARESLPVVTGISEQPVLGAPLLYPATAEALSRFLQALALVPELEIAEFNLGDALNLVMYTIDGREIRLGGVEQMEQKLFLVWQSLPYLTAAGRSGVIDVRSGDRLVLNPERTSTAGKEAHP
jgi:cell division protein FtsQ